MLDKLGFLEAVEAALQNKEMGIVDKGERYFTTGEKTDIIYNQRVYTQF